MGKTRLVLALLLVGVIAAGAFATPIAYISATTVPTSFTPIGGSFGFGVLTLNGVRPVVIHFSDSSQSTIADSSFVLSTNLKQDLSSGGMAKGTFEAGSLVIKDSNGNTLLAGIIGTADLEEAATGGEILIATGTLAVVGGSLEGQFGEYGTIYDLIFTAETAPIDNLALPFSGVSDISIVPVPEPATIALLGLGLAGIVARRRKK